MADNRVNPRPVALDDATVKALGGVLDSTGAPFAPDNLAQVIGRNAAGGIISITAGPDANGVTRVQTITRDGLNNITSISKWVPA